MNYDLNLPFLHTTRDHRELRADNRLPLAFLPLFIAASCIYWSPAAYAADSRPWQSGPGYRDAPLSVPETGAPGFHRVPPDQTGIAFTNRLSDRNAALNQIRLNGSGIAAGDVDGDGWCDLYFCGLENRNALYRNLGNGRFEEITEEAGVGCPNQFSTGTALADLDGDGDLDLLVNALGGGTRSFLNDGRGRFKESTESGLRRCYGSMSMALADIDDDGDLDLYVANYRTTTVRSTGLQMLLVNGKRMLKPEDRDQMYITSDGFLREYGEVDQLYLNQGNGRFEPVSWTEGSFQDAHGRALDAPPKDWGLSVMFRDINQDGAPDLYVCNDFWSPDRCWLNDGTGRFKALPREAMANTSSFSMGVDFADINRDGWDDFVVLDMLSRNHQRRIRQTTMADHHPKPIGFPRERPQLKRNTLFLNRGDGTYAEIARFSNLHASDWSWCPVFLDVDLDGYEDLLVTTGFRFDTQDADAEQRIQESGPWPRKRIPEKLLMYPHLPQANLAFRNQGDLTFEETGEAWGFNSKGVSQGMCLADLDRDGDQDVVVNHANDFLGLYRNNASGPRIAVRLKGAPPNTQGIGARVTLRGGAVESQSQEMVGGGRYLSGDDPTRTFAAGAGEGGCTIEVLWPSERRSYIEEVKANYLYEIVEPNTKLRPGNPVRDDSGSMETIEPWFEDVRDWLPHEHEDAPFDDFGRQPLLPWKLSSLGPGLSWFDVDRDGWEDLLRSSGRGGHQVVYLNKEGTGFRPMRESPPMPPTAATDRLASRGSRRRASAGDKIHLAPVPGRTRLM
jgi:hypothetical protein